jgi:hypothetical protein
MFDVPIIQGRLNPLLQVGGEFGPELRVGFHQTRDIGEILHALALPLRNIIPSQDLAVKGQNSAFDLTMATGASKFNSLILG